MNIFPCLYDDLQNNVIDILSPYIAPSSFKVENPETFGVKYLLLQMYQKAAKEFADHIGKEYSFQH